MTAGEAAAARAVEVAVSGEGFRAAMRTVPAPVTVVATLTGTGAHATTVSAFASLSADPPLVLVALDRSSELLATLSARDGARFSVHVLRAGQEDLARHCANKHPDKLATTAWHERDGVPFIEGSATWLACVVDDLVAAGDHVIVTGLVVATELAGGAPLVYRERRFHALG